MHVGAVTEQQAVVVLVLASFFTATLKRLTMSSGPRAARVGPDGHVEIDTVVAEERLDRVEVALRKCLPQTADGVRHVGSRCPVVVN